MTLINTYFKDTEELREKLRVHIRDDDLKQSPGQFHDEFYTHRLAMLAKIPQEKEPLDLKWCYCSYRPEPEKAYMIHIRPRVKIYEPERAKKIDNYYMLKARGVF